MRCLKLPRRRSGPPVANCLGLLLSAAVLAPLMALSACGSANREEPEPTATSVPSEVGAAPRGAVPVVESSYGTPVKDRVATLGFLNKRNNVTQDVVLRSGEARRIGNVVIRLATCERTLPWEKPAEEGAFVQLFVEERATNAAALQWRKVFSGWMFKNSPSLNVVEHPVYDVWLKSCAMKFPGEEEDAAATSSNSAKATGRVSARPAARGSLPALPEPSAPPAAREEDGA